MRGLAALATAALLAACAPWQPAADPGRPPAARPEARVIETPPAWYQVRRGDTLYSIAFRYGLDWRNLARWNGIDAPYTIRPGLELRTSAPPRPVAAAPKPAPAPAATSAAARAGAKKPPVASAPKRGPAGSASTAAAVKSGDNSRSVGGVVWQWPTAGRLARKFDPADTRKGIGLAGEAGQDVLAAASGQVVYSGTALIGYGELIIIKHSDTLLSAYGHNRRRLVAEGERVQRGQKIAEMGRNDRREEMLHFEIRQRGEPVNPLDYLPPGR